MEFFDSGHLASGLGDLDAVADEDGLEVDAKEAWVEPEDQSAPGVGELVQIQGRAMEAVQEPVVAGRLQAQSAHDAGRRADLCEWRIRPGRGTSTGRCGSVRRRSAIRTPDSTSRTRSEEHTSELQSPM